MLVRHLELPRPPAAVVPAPRPADRQRATAPRNPADVSAPPAETPYAAASPSEPSRTSAPAVEAVSPDPDGEEVPTYATQRPPPLRLRYATQRGVRTGEAELTWQTSPYGWRLLLEGSALGAADVGWASEGGFDAAGLAPRRHTALRRGREQRAVNFQREAGRITFSGPGVSYQLRAGAQDRLSWWVQLPAVLQANPALAEPGAQISLWVVGGRGDAEVWTFTVQGRGPLELPVGPVADAIELLREPRRLYDQQVRVWLDPARHHLPVQAELRLRAATEGTRLQLTAVLPPPPVEPREP